MVETKRWIIVVENGGNCVVSENKPPEESILFRAEDGLSAMGLGGWLAVEEMAGNSVRNRMAICKIGHPRTTWKEAQIKLENSRQDKPRQPTPIPPDNAPIGMRF